MDAPGIKPNHTQAIFCTHGYSLMELMTVLVLITVLLSIALPNYHQYLLRAYRNEAHLILLRAHAMQASYFAKHHHYASSAEDLYAKLSKTNERLDNARYQLRIQPTKDCPSGVATLCYELAVHARGAQSKDRQCAVWRMNQNGALHVYDDQGVIGVGCL